VRNLIEVGGNPSTDAQDALQIFGRDMAEFKRYCTLE